MYEIIPINQDIRDKAVSLISEHWGSHIIVTRGKIHSAKELHGYVVLSDDKIKGLITYEIINNECEIVSLDSMAENQGIGTGLMERVAETAKAQGCKRVWLVTTNDNTKAIRFYQKKGMKMVGLYVDAIRESRKIKP